MNSGTDVCSFCGGEIIFRVIRGVTTPVHVGDSGCIGRRIYKNDQEGIPHYVRCPKCDASVIFLRYNGGSVWLEELGQPWPKHPCFDDKPCRDKAAVIPPAVINLSNPTFLYVKFIGRLNTQTGIVLLLGATKNQLRRNPKNVPHMQYVVSSSPTEMEEAVQRFSEAVGVFISFKDARLITMDGRAFDIRDHKPKYCK